MDKITINDLEVFYHVGVPDEERARPQRLLLTLEMEIDFTKAAACDDLTKTIDYFAVSQRLISFGHGKAWRLIETLALEITDLVLNEFKAKRATVEVKKFIIPETKFVGVKVSRPEKGVRE
jgi:FolB domain-containing protein